MYVKEGLTVMPIEFLFIFLIFLIGSFIQGVSGFGFGLFAMGFLPLMFTLKDSTLLVLSLTLFISLTIVFRIYRYIELKGFLVILCAALTGRVVSFFFLTSYGEMDILKKVLGFFLIGMVIYLLTKKKGEPSKLLLKPIFPITFGFVGGLIGGIFAVGGPFFVFYFLMIYKEKHRYNANLQTTFAVTSLFTMFLHGLNGDFDSTFLLYFAVGLVSVFVGANVGLRLFEKLPQEKIKLFAMCIVFLAAVNLLVFT
ncbi:sulfite exporter TauE/SafE family protein [Alkalihalobacillus oceani]|uniref:sulfite exporter TauE/SafE family protein n=1 Tax=Halalkalibacter oceani TaxID=1653776 RepID=UPI00203F0DD6|nr:sulfite exporter TauE/SafE family protein [Halalkalibacter oceani]MCM3761713.1 sulfite exporter TauE/SafE family protein [Halalkalibacter oceani]